MRARPVRRTSLAAEASALLLQRHTQRERKLRVQVRIHAKVETTPAAARLAAFTSASTIT